MTNITKSVFKMLTLSGFNSQSARVEGSQYMGGSQNRHQGEIYGSTTVRYKTLIQIQKKYKQIALFNLYPLLSHPALEIQSQTYKVNRNICEVACECDFFIPCENTRLLTNLRKSLKHIKPASKRKKTGYISSLTIQG